MVPINLKNLLLASHSPRRKELLEGMGIKVEVVPSNINEETISIKEPEAYVKALAFLKAENISLSYPDDWVLGADTIVVVQNKILGKPESENHAMEMLKLLNNRSHTVFTGFCILNRKKNILVERVVETTVFFKSLSDQEILWYVKTGEPFDKAGAYGIQGVGAFLVKEISGSYSNVVGLPVCEVVETLMNLKIIQMRT